MSADVTLNTSNVLEQLSDPDVFWVPLTFKFDRDDYLVFRNDLVKGAERNGLLTNHGFADMIAYFPNEATAHELELPCFAARAVIRLLGSLLVFHAFHSFPLWLVWTTALKHGARLVSGNPIEMAVAVQANVFDVSYSTAPARCKDSFIRWSSRMNRMRLTRVD
jgi:hypothetical protein